MAYDKNERNDSRRIDPNSAGEQTDSQQNQDYQQQSYEQQNQGYQNNQQQGQGYRNYQQQNYQNQGGLFSPPSSAAFHSALSLSFMLPKWIHFGLQDNMLLPMMQPANPRNGPCGVLSFQPLVGSSTLDYSSLLVLVPAIVTAIKLS